MAEDETQLFDPSMKKKKKKKNFDPDALTDSKPAEEDDPSSETQAEPSASNVDLDEFDFTKMKKKPKKKKAFDMSELSSAVDAADDESPKQEEAGDDKPEESAVDSLDFDFKNEKKKKKKKAKLDDILSEKAAEQPADEGEAWVDSGKDYTYDELLKRVFDIMKEKNPDMVAGEKKRLVMKPPQVVKIGAKKTSFANFTDICKSLHRQPKHLLAFLMAELGTSGSIDGNNQLIIKGRFQSKQIENVLRNYIKEYVSCHTCKSPDTILQKDTRLYFLQCETCRSRCSVSSIKSGFQAVTGKRAAIRAKTA